MVGITCKALTMLLAPKTLWALMNLSGSFGGKYGARIQLSLHRRLRNLQAAQGPWKAVEGGENLDEEGEDDEKGIQETASGLVVLSISAYSILRDREREKERERERAARRQWGDCGWIQMKRAYIYLGMKWAIKWSQSAPWFKCRKTIIWIFENLFRDLNVDTSD